MPILTSFRSRILAAASSILLASSAFAVPLVFHPGQTLDNLQLGASGQVVATWLAGGISVIDPQTLAVTDLETARSLIPMAETTDSLFYAFYATQSSEGQLKTLRGLDIQVIAEQPSDFAIMGERLLTTRVPGQELRVTDGTPAGTFSCSTWCPAGPQCGFPCDPSFNCRATCTAPPKASSSS